MDFKKLGIVIQREYLNKVKKKSFLLTTFGVPILFAGMYAVMIFIIPPSMEELRRRLIRRGTDSMEAIEGRLERARAEYAEAEIYDYLIVNEDADVAASEFSAIVKAEHLRTRDRLYLLK